MHRIYTCVFFFFFNDPAPPEISPFPLPDPLPFFSPGRGARGMALGSPAAGHVSMTGEPSASVSMAFVVSPLSQGANTLPLTLNATYTTVDNAAGTSIVTFVAPTATTLSGGASGQLFVYVAGTVAPAANQVAGNYSGTIQLTVIYQ